MSNSKITLAVSFHSDRAHKSTQLVRGYVAAGILAGLPNSEFTPFIDAGTVSRIRGAVKGKQGKTPTAPTASAELLAALATVDKRSTANDKIAAEFGVFFSLKETERVKGATPAAKKSESEPSKGTGNASLPEDVDIRALVFDTIVNAKTDADAEKFIAALADWATEGRVERQRKTAGKTVRKAA